MNLYLAEKLKKQIKRIKLFPLNSLDVRSDIGRRSLNRSKSDDWPNISIWKSYLVLDYLVHPGVYE